VVLTSLLISINARNGNAQKQHNDDNNVNDDNYIKPGSKQPPKKSTAQHSSAHQSLM